MASESGHHQAMPGNAVARPAAATFFFLRTKLLPPRPVPELLLRPRLTERLLANLAHPLTLVTANAGSGKTTLVADFVRKHSDKFIWYQLDHTDADPFVFLGYVTNGIKQVVEGFGDITLSYLQQSADELARQPERAVDVLLNEVLEGVEQRLILVLDDYHHLGNDTPVHRVVDRLLSYLPDVMHIIMISRDIPPLGLARLRSQASLAIIDRNDLLFTDEETQELFRKVFDLEITSEQLIEYRQRTHGWITALQLVRQVAQRQALAGGEAPDLVEILRQSEHDIFDYFAEEVFADEEAEVQYLLLRIALLDRVEARLCTQLYTDLNCRSILPALVRRNVFLTVASDERGEEYRLHPLFQSFLRRRLRLEIGRAGIAAEHLRFAEHFLSIGQWEQGVRYLLKGEDFERAAQVIGEHGGEWIAAGALSSLHAFAESIPSAIIEKYPRALACQAEVLRLRGEYDAAQSILRRAATLLQEQGDREGEAEALHSLATIVRWRGDCETAFQYLDRAVELADDKTAIKIKCGNTRGLCLHATGDLPAAEREFRAALQFAEEQGDEHYARLIAHNLGLPAMVRGDFGEALRWLRRMLRDQNDSPPMPRDATAHLNIARSHLYRGDFEACEKHLNLALECSQLFNLTSLRGEIFETFGNFYRASNDVARAVEFYERAGRAYEDAGIELKDRELLEEQAILCLQAGDLPTARFRIDQLIKARAAAGNELGVLIASLARGRIQVAQGEGASAFAEVQPACSYFRKQGLHYYEAQASLTLTVCAWQLGKEGEMLEYLRRALDLAVSYDYEYWLQQEVLANRALFALPDALALLPAELREQVALAAPLVAPTVKPGAMVNVVAPPVTDLTIFMLGHVEIFRDPTHPLTAEVWTTRRARDILCFIASRPHRRASKDTIIDTFWNDAEFEVIEKNFHPTVSHIRKALNSKQTLKQNFLLYRDGDYQLNPDFSYRIDTEDFDRLLAEGEAARRARDFEKCATAYAAAVALYRGEFMKGGYDMWMEEPRAYYSEQYLRMLIGLTEIAQKSDEWERVLELSQRILRDDPFREEIHCRVMRAHAALGNRVAVKEQFEALRKLLQKELGVEPAAETQRLYRELLK
ncbi:MAG: tetratricopeptide repeat protein [Acidobacteria bacterium]|nr:tetratricopeptide repeat protein [Acidobacteriota bacterium]